VLSPIFTEGVWKTIAHANADGLAKNCIFEIQAKLMIWII